MLNGKLLKEDIDTTQNFPVLVEGKVYWISRACAVVGFVYKKIDGVWHILANQRGSGTPDFQFKWNVPCGYLDKNETGNQAISRELLEECGFKINPKKWKEIETQTDPSVNNQNVTIRYLYVVDDDSDETFNISECKGGETDEVADVKWVSVKDIKLYEWAFDHDKLISIYLLKHVQTTQELLNEMKLNVE